NLAELLEKEPITIEAEQAYRQRTYADVRLEIRNQLTQLEPLHAHCRLQRPDGYVEHTITLTLPPALDGDRQHVAAFRQHSREGYYQERARVEAEIARRQQGNDDDETATGTAGPHPPRPPSGRPRRSSRETL